MTITVYYQRFLKQLNPGDLFRAYPWSSRPKCFRVRAKLLSESRYTKSETGERKGKGGKKKR